MNNNVEQINRYLQDEMSHEEKAAFEMAMSLDNGLQQETEIQKQIMQAAVNAGIKAEFAQAMQIRPAAGKFWKWGLPIAAAILIALMLIFRSSIFPAGDAKSIVTQELAAITAPFINPPMHEINVPLSEYFFDAEKGTTIFHATGSIINFPASSLVDKSGNIVKGKVKVTYREFRDPVDFFVSGIPMSYDSAGRQYQFESSGMCEINAYKDDRPVFVNKNAPPEIHLSSENKSPLHNLYYLDTVSRKWDFIGKDQITEVKDLARTKKANISRQANESNGIPTRPVMPAKADEDKQSFSIEIDPGSFEELNAYDKLKFQVEDPSTYRRSDAEEHWDSVKLVPTDKEGVYAIQFTNPKRKVNYKVKPVLEGEDYDEALNTFKQKNAAYELALQRRIELDKNMSDSIVSLNKKKEEKHKADLAENEKLNELIIERNRSMREQRTKLKEEADSMSALYEEQMLVALENQRKYSEYLQSSQEILRSFAINRFGIWNCDHPHFPGLEVPITAIYVDSASNSISFSGVSVVYGGLNGITQFPPGLIRVIPGRNNMIWSISDKYFYYLTFKDFAATGITKETRSYAFRMRRSDKPVSTYEQIRDLVGSL